MSAARCDLSDAPRAPQPRRAAWLRLAPAPTLAARLAPLLAIALSAVLATAAQAQRAPGAQPASTDAQAAAGTRGKLAAPRGKVVLSIRGRIRHTNAADRADFDMAMLEALPQHRFSTSSPWYAEPHTFSGPLLREVLARAGASGTWLKAVALNDYKVDLPMDDAQRYTVIVATRLDGKPMPVRDKGPLFIIYPFDADAQLRSERFYSRSAWQLRALEVR